MEHFSQFHVNTYNKINYDNNNNNNNNQTYTHKPICIWAGSVAGNWRINNKKCYNKKTTKKTLQISLSRSMYLVSFVYEPNTQDKCEIVRSEKKSFAINLIIDYCEDKVKCGILAHVVVFFLFFRCIYFSYSFLKSISALILFVCLALSSLKAHWHSSNSITDMHMTFI